MHSYDTQRSQSRGAGWSKAEIIDVDGDKLSLTFELEPVLSNRTLDRWSNELAIAETETKQIWQWKATLKENDLVDALDDTYTWRQSTLIRLYEEKEGDKVIPMALVGLRIYQANGPRSDERGPYDGFGSRFDEKIPLYSPKITGYRTRSTKDKSDADGEVDEGLDDFINPYEGCSRSWAVPRPRKCTSRAYLTNLSMFCEAGGLQVILDSIRDNECSDKNDEFNLTILACLISAASLPALTYHKAVIADFGGQLVTEAKKKLLGAPDKALRDMRREAIDAITKAVDLFNKRLMKREDRKPALEGLKLDVCLLCLSSSFL